MSRVPIGQLLLEFGYVTEEQIHVALEVKQIRNKLLGEVLIELSFVSPREIAQAISRQSGKSYLDIAEHPPSKDALRLLDKGIAKQLEILPINIHNNRLIVCMADPFNINAVDILRRRAGMELDIYVSDRESILKNIEVNYFLLERPIEQEIKGVINKARAGDISSEIPNLMDLLLNHAIIERATDIHISPEDVATHIFYRIDGIMRHYYAFPKRIHTALVSRIKILSNLDIAEQRLPQDGSMSHEFFDEHFDIRVSTIPTAYGENVVLRILSKNLSLFNLESLGFEDIVLKTLDEQFAKPQGIILVTGPTGSGKTTTLYAALRKINALQRRVLTAEDPVEYKFPFIKQTQVNDKAGYTFATAMRAFLRQDPDVILLGEMRDEETAEMAMRAAITGHLVLSTMHTNDALTAIPRLADMKIKNYLIAAGVTAILSQRLVRKVCIFCGTTRQMQAQELLEYGFTAATLKRFRIDPTAQLSIPQANGCEHCRKSGYSGRSVINEVLVIDDEIGDMIIRGCTPLEIQAKAQTKGMIPMREDGLIKILKGVTTPEEIKRVVT